MQLTKKEKEILKWIENNKSITINQCAKILYTKNKYAYYQARRKLRNLYERKLLQRYRANCKSEVIYYTIKKLNIHDLKVFDVYAELIHLGAKILYFKKEFKIQINKKKHRKIDALIEIEYDGYFIPIICEVDYTHYTSFKKIQDIYNSNYFQTRFKDVDKDLFPIILIVRPVISIKEDTENTFKIIYTDFTLENLNMVLE